MIRSFLVGAIAGGTVVWLYGDRIRTAVDEATRDARGRVAGQLRGAAQTLESVADTVDQGLSPTARRVRPA
jgi:hypothetical protein